MVRVLHLGFCLFSPLQPPGQVESRCLSKHCTVFDYLAHCIPVHFCYLPLPTELLGSGCGLGGVRFQSSANAPDDCRDTNLQHFDTPHLHQHLISSIL